MGIFNHMVMDFVFKKSITWVSLEMFWTNFVHQLAEDGLGWCRDDTFSENPYFSLNVFNTKNKTLNIAICSANC